MQKRLKEHYIPQLTGVVHDGQPIEPPRPLPWYPDGLAWQMTASRKVVRKSPPFRELQKFLVSETSVGHMSRQEAVSMIPPLLMDVRPGMAVLDMCAAPGSKAAQLLEMVHGGEEARMRKAARDARAVADGRSPASPVGPEIKHEIQELEQAQPEFPDDGRATGLLVANDADYKRAYMLVHQLKRLNSANLIVTNHDATHFPSLALPPLPAADGQPPAPAAKRYLKFDRILADVPCSGDGTPRKNVNVWRDWSPGNALGLHPNQERLLVRALQMLKVGGRVVYSTCSMNPVENEAVVAAAVARCGGAAHVDLVDCADMLPSLKRRPGLTEWIVMDKSGTTWKSWADVQRRREEQGEGGLGKLAAGMFPPGPAGEQPPLDRCMRVYGQMQDTGAFFIAVLEKKKEIRARPEGEAKAEATKMPEAKTEAPPITAVVNEVESKTATSSSAMEHISAADALATKAVKPEQEDAPIIQNGETNGSIPSEETTAMKREPEDAMPGPHMPEKRRKIDTSPSPAPDPSALAPAPESPPPVIITPTISSLPPRPVPTVHRKSNAPTEEPFTFLPPTHPVLEQCFAFYDLAARVPRDRFLVRNATGDAVKVVYYAAPAARAVLTANAGSGVKFVQSGVRMFVRQDVPRPEVCGWRIQSEGLPLLAPWVGARRVLRLADRGVLRALLVEMFPKVEGEGARDLGAWGDMAREKDMGCYVLRVEPGGGAPAELEEGLVLPLWKGIKSVNLMLPKEDRRAMLLRLFGEDVPLVDHSVVEKVRETKAKEEAAEEGGAQGAEQERRNSSSEGERAGGDEEDGAKTAMEDLDVGMTASDAVGVDDTGELVLADGDVEKEAELEVDLARGVKDEVDVERAAAEHLAEEV